MKAVHILSIVCLLILPASASAQTWKKVSPGPCDTGGEGSGGSDPSGFPAATTLDASCASLSIGQTCTDSAGMEVFYIGALNGKRLYGMMSDISASSAYKSENTAGGGPSQSDGMVNTSVMTLPTNLMFYPAAVACKAVGVSYYLPAREEWQVIANNAATINMSAKGFNTSNNSYWTSTESASNQAWYAYGSSTWTVASGAGKIGSNRVRCIRR